MHLATASAAMTLSGWYESGTTDLLETGRRGPMLSMLCSPAAAAAVVAAGTAPAAVVAATEEVDVRDTKDEAARHRRSRWWLGRRCRWRRQQRQKTPKVVTPRRDATGVARRANGRPTARRSYAADAKDGGTLSASPHPRRSDAAVVGLAGR